MNDNELSMRNGATKVIKHYCAGRSIFSCLLHVVKVIGQAVVCTHTGCASASTSARNFNGRSSGVNRSTCRPNSDSSSTCRPPRSISVAPGKASTSRSISLPSWSVPCSTEPNTRGLVVGNRATVARTAARCISSTREGRMGILSGRKLLKC